MCPDELDQVQEHIDRFQNNALVEHQRHREPDDNASICCVDCDNEIPLKRRQAKPGCRRCIDCQETFETEATA